MLNLFNLKVYAILICRGEIRQKAEHLFDLIMLKNRKKEFIFWNNQRLKECLKMIIYFSEVLPKKYINEVMHFKGMIIQMSPKGKLGDETKRIMNTEQKDEQWQEDNVKILESSFNDIIDSIYDDLFIDRMYGKNLKSAIDKDEFLNCVGGSKFGALFGSMGNMMGGSMKGPMDEEGAEETKGDNKTKKGKKKELDPDAQLWQEI